MAPTPPPDDKETQRLPNTSQEENQPVTQRVSPHEQRQTQREAQREQDEAQRKAKHQAWQAQQEAQRQAKRDQHEAQHAMKHAAYKANHPASGWEAYAREHPPAHAYTPRGDAQRQALIQAAFHLIAQSGMEHFRTREVAGRAGVNIATLHYYFTTKEDLIRAVVEYMASEFAARRINAEQAGESARAKGPLAELRAELADTLSEIREYPELFYVLTELSIRAWRDPIIREMMRTLNANWHEWLTGILARGVQEGVFRADLDPQVAARMLMGVTKGSTMEIMNEPENYPIERIHEEIERWLTGYVGPAPTP